MDLCVCVCVRVFMLQKRKKKKEETGQICEFYIYFQFPFLFLTGSKMFTSRWPLTPGGRWCGPAALGQQGSLRRQRVTVLATQEVASLRQLCNGRRTTFPVRTKGGTCLTNRPDSLKTHHGAKFNSSPPEGSRVCRPGLRGHGAPADPGSLLKDPGLNINIIFNYIIIIYFFNIHVNGWNATRLIVPHVTNRGSQTPDCVLMCRQTFIDLQHLKNVVRSLIAGQ